MITLKSNKKPDTILSVAPGVFFYYTGLAGFIKADSNGDGNSDLFEIKIDQDNSDSDFSLFKPIKNDVKLWEITDSNNNGIIDAGDDVSQVRSKDYDVSFGTGTDFGDVTIDYTPSDADADKSYVISVKYDTSTVKGDKFNTDVPEIVNYTFETEMGGLLIETDPGGVDMHHKFTPPTSPLLLDGEPNQDVNAAVLDETALQNVVDQVLGHLSELGASADVMSILRDTDIQISDLSSQNDGKTLSQWDGSVITFDDDAAGYGWSEDIGSINPDQIDLLSSVVHEIGHVIGYEHDVLDPDLAVGERDLPYIDAEVASTWTVVDEQIDIVGVQDTQFLEFAG